MCRYFSRRRVEVHIGGEDGVVRTWDWENAIEVRPRLKHPAAVHAIARLIELDRVATTCLDGLLRIWDIESGTVVASGSIGQGSKTATGYLSLAVDPNGGRLAVGSWQGAGIFSSSTAKRVASLKDPAAPTTPVEAVAFFSDGRLLTVDNRTVARVWDTDGDMVLFGPYRTSDARGVRTVSAAVRPDGDVVAVGHMNDHRVSILSSNGRQTIGTLPHGALVNDISYSSDGKRIVTGSDDTTAQIWSGITSRPIGPSLRHAGGVKVAMLDSSGDIC